MELHGTLAENLRHAIKSARGLRGKAVYPDTLAYWADLLEQARDNREGREGAPSFDALITALQDELAERSAPGTVSI